MVNGKGKKIGNGKNETKNTKKIELSDSDSEEMDEKSQSKVEIEQFLTFTTTFEKLKKKYPHIADDINPYIAEFYKQNFEGNRDSDFTYPVYKLRIANSDRKRGRDAGYRLIYLKKNNTYILLMILYSKTDQDDLSIQQIKSLDQKLDSLYQSRGWKK